MVSNRKIDRESWIFQHTIYSDEWRRNDTENNENCMNNAWHSKIS